MVLRDVQRARKNLFPKYTNSKIFRHVAYSKKGLFTALVKLSFLNMPHKGPHDERRITCCSDKFDQNLRCANLIKEYQHAQRHVTRHQTPTRLPAAIRQISLRSPPEKSLLWEVKKRSRESDENQA